MDSESLAVARYDYFHRVARYDHFHRLVWSQKNTRKTGA